MSSYTSKRFLIPFFIGCLGFLTILLSEYIGYSQGNKIVEITWLASLFVVVSTLIVRFYSVDSGRVSKIMTESNPLKNSELHPYRYLNWMVIAMIVGFIATVTIAYDFIYGMIIYLIMQLCLIFSFSGIITLNPSKFRVQPHLFRKIVVIILIWLLLIPAVYFTLVYSGPNSLVVIPYVIIIGVMACLSWFGLVYDHRSRLFRWLMVIASGLFVFSDILVGNAEYGTIEINLNFLIDITYVFNIFLMSHAILFQQGSFGMSPVKTNKKSYSL